MLPEQKSERKQDAGFSDNLRPVINGAHGPNRAKFAKDKEEIDKSDLNL